MAKVSPEDPESIDEALAPPAPNVDAAAHNHHHGGGTDDSSDASNYKSGDDDHPANGSSDKLVPADNNNKDTNNTTGNEDDDINNTFREVSISNVSRNAHFCDNSVSTSKYTLLSFLPKGLFEQFRRLANVYFLIVSVLQVSTDLSPTNKYATILPLCGVITLTLMKEAFEDWNRRVADQAVNNSVAYVVDARSGVLRRVLWSEVRVGNILQLSNMDTVCADGIVLSTCDSHGMCYIETANLDGETNLKIRKALPITKHMNKSTFMSDLRGVARCDEPNPNIYRFEGHLELTSGIPNDLRSCGAGSTRSRSANAAFKQPRTENVMMTDGKNGEQIPIIPITNNNVLLRGSKLRNTPRVFLLVVYTGSDTKQMQNTRDTPSKRSNVDRLINHVILLVFLTLLVMCVLSSILFSVWVTARSEPGMLWYLPIVAEITVMEKFTSFITFLILFNNLVPISLYVSLELVKLVQAKLIESDMKLYNPKTNKPAVVRTSSLNEDLGQIQYVFSDKTGTLTRNEMVYKMCSVNGSVYASPPKPGLNGLHRSPLEELSKMGGSRSNLYGGMQFDQVKKSSRMLRVLKHQRDGYENIRDLLRMLAVCNTVVPVTTMDPQGGTTLRLQSASPDEEALVKAAYSYGFETLSRDDAQVVVKAIKEMQSFEILHVIEFTSARKCMSVLVRTPEGNIEVYCKGADDVLLSRLASSPDENDDEQQQQQQQNNGNLDLPLSGSKVVDGADVLRHHLHWFATTGLRTLVFAKASLDDDFYEDWARRWVAAQAIVSGDKDEELGMLAAEVETGLTLIGATAIEDRLQRGVPEAVEMLEAAGIKVWMLTGDKTETAINIGMSCRLLNQEMTLIRLDFGDKMLMDMELEKARRLLDAKIALTEAAKVDRRMSAVPMGLDQIQTKAAIVVDGKCLTLILENNEASKAFFDLCHDCQAVVACRVSPRQKASLVRLVKKHVVPAPMTLAIGDGANDVGMLQEAHIGVGINGNEGMQAVRSSDYAIAQFRYLSRLVLVHGNWNYRRVTNVILYSFYKNIANVLTLFYYCIYNGYSGTSLYESWLSAGWNVGWTFLPVIIFGIIDRDLNSDTIRRFPQVYQRGQMHTLFNLRKMAKWVFNAVVHSLVVFGLAIGSLSNNISASNGQTHGLWTMGTIVNGCMVILVNFKIALESAHWTIYHVSAILFSTALWFSFVHIYSIVAPQSLDYLHIGYNLHSRLLPWLIYLLVPLAAIILDLAYTYMHKTYWPDPIVIAQEIQKRDIQRQKLVGAIAEEDEDEAFCTSDALINTDIELPVASQAMLDIPAYDAAAFQNQQTGIASSFAFSYPTYESAMQAHGEEEYMKDKAHRRSGHGKDGAGHDRRKHKKHRRSSRYRSGGSTQQSNPRVIIHGPTVEALAFLEQQLLEEAIEEEKRRIRNEKNKTRRKRSRHAKKHTAGKLAEAEIELKQQHEHEYEHEKDQEQEKPAKGAGGAGEANQADVTLPNAVEETTAIADEEGSLKKSAEDKEEPLGQGGKADEDADDANAFAPAV